MTRLANEYRAWEGFCREQAARAKLGGEGTGCCDRPNTAALVGKKLRITDIIEMFLIF